MKKKLVSLVVTTKNEERNIKNCLSSIKKQLYPSSLMEVLVIDNDSSDKTKSIVKNFKINNKKLSISLFNFGPERSAQRNFGAKKADGEYYIYLDADMILSKNMIEECVKKYDKLKYLKGLYIPEVIMGNGFWSNVRRFERSFYNGTVIDCLRFVKLEDFKKVGGFDEAMSGPEDWDFDKKIRDLGKVDIIKACIYHNEAHFSLFKYLYKKKYYSKSFDIYIKKWGLDNPDIKKQFGLFYRYLGVFIENGKWKRLISHPILAAGMFLLRFCVGFIYLFSKL